MRVKRIEPHAVERFIERVLPMTSGPHKSYLSRPGSPEKVLFYIANNQKLERESEGGDRYVGQFSSYDMCLRLTLVIVNGCLVTLWPNEYLKKK